ncbi:MAG: hypothetical protein ISP53_05630 [Flavobacteriaceae bacterium]|nr:hypothetical protein [Flavobacteriaceae bacterium]
MTNFTLTVLAITLLSLSNLTEKSEELEFYGIWRTLDNEFVQIGRNSEFETYFERVSPGKGILAKGKILNVGERTIEVLREYPKDTIYFSDYAFSPSKNTLIIMKPNSNRAWVLEKIR